jgi:hypothetical protein
MSATKFARVLAEYESREDDLGQRVFSAARLSQDCEDCDLNGSLEDLERALEKGWEQHLAQLEEDVEAAYVIIQNAFEDRDRREAMRDYYGTDD